MKLIQKLTYLMMVIGIYMLLGAIEYFVLNWIIEIFTFNYLVKLIVALCVLIIVNPMITYYLTEKVTFKVSEVSNSEV